MEKTLYIYLKKNNYTRNMSNRTQNNSDWHCFCCQGQTELMEEICRHYCVKTQVKGFITTPSWCHSGHTSLCWHYCFYTEALELCYIHKVCVMVPPQLLCWGIWRHLPLSGKSNRLCMQHDFYIFLIIHKLWFNKCTCSIYFFSVLLILFIIHFIYYSYIVSVFYILPLSFIVKYFVKSAVQNLDDDWGAWNYVHWKSTCSMAAQCYNFQNHRTNDLLRLNI